MEEVKSFLARCENGGLVRIISREVELVGKIKEAFIHDVGIGRFVLWAEVNAKASPLKKRGEKVWHEMNSRFIRETFFRAELEGESLTLFSHETRIILTLN